MSNSIETTVIPQIRNVIYGLYSSFPTSGILVGDLAWATDLKCLYRWSGTEWQSIGISSRHGNYADIGNPADYPESSLYQADDQALLYMVVSGAWEQITFIIKGLPDWLAGNILGINADTERSTTATTYTKVKEIIVATGGIIRVCFDIKCSIGGIPSYGKVYKNGAALGTERNNDTASYVTYSEDLAFAAGDLVQLYLKATSGYTCYARNFQLKADVGHMHRVIVD